MPHDILPEPGRRDFLKIGALLGAGLIVGFRAGANGEAVAATGDLVANPFVRITPDDTVVIYAKHIEFGQGSFTGLATLAAEELDADWAQVKIEAAPADASKYANLNWGETQGTGGSSAMNNSYMQYRQAGATARALLVEAAAQEWKVPAAEIAVSKGTVSHAKSGRSVTFGSLAAKASQLTPPAEAPLKDPKLFTLIGKVDLKRKDTLDKAHGIAAYTMDVKLPGLLTAVIARPPKFGAAVKSFDAAAAKAVKGVTDVIQIPQGIAVVGEWDDSKAEKRGTTELLAEYKALLAKPGIEAREDGDAGTALKNAAKVVGGVFEFPYLAHAPMEPLDCVVKLDGDKCTIWSGSQMPTVDQLTAASVLGLKPENVTINTLYAGGSFGRRAVPDAAWTAEAVTIAKALNGRAPVKLVYTREDDIQGGRYRPVFVHEIRAGLDKDANVVGWRQRIVGQSFVKGTLMEGALIRNGVDQTAVEGASNLAYSVPNIAVDLHMTEVGVPTLWWRSVGHTHTAYAVETVIDQLAEAAGADPVEFRRKLLASKPRHLGVLNLAAEKAGWGKPVPAGVARGVAVHESFKSFVAQVVDVRIGKDGKVKVDRVVCAVDCGIAINPDVIKAQMEGGIGFGLGAVLTGAITMTGGVVDQSNFHDYIPLRIGDMPEVEVHIVPSAEPPTGVGEPGVPPIGPAVANAVYRLTGKRIQSLPFSLHELGKA
jgi:isoquinoline 1-oxidoreductase beta subunit